MSRGGGVARTILKVVLAYAHRGGRLVYYRPLVGWYTYSSYSLMGRFRSFSITLDSLHFSLKRFFVGVCRVAESGGRAFDFGELVPSGCVLCRLSEEFFDLVSPALDTWKVVRGLMASEESSWHEVRSEELPEGLSDRGEDSRSQEEAPSVSDSSRVVGPDDSWIARSYLSKVVDVEGLEKYRRRYQIPEDVILRILESDEVACSSKYGDVAFYEADFNAGVRFPLQPLMKELLDRPSLSPGQLALNAWRTVVACMVMWKVCSDGKDDLTVDELLFCYKPCKIAASPGFWSLNARQRGLKLVIALKRSKLNQDGHNRVLRALHHREHHFKHFIRPELLALYSFGPELSEAVLSLQEINQKRMATAKLNKEKLMKMMSQQEEVPLTLGKRRKTGSSSKKVVDEASLPPPPIQKTTAPAPVPASSVEVVEVPTEPSSSKSVEKVSTLPRDASLASRRAKTVVMKEDIREYDKVNTDVVKVAGVHSLMKGLTELTVIANRCIQWEEALLKQKGDMTRKEEDLRKALDGAKRANEQVKMLASQLEAAKVSAVEEFKSSEAYDDNNTKYFLSGFSFLKKQAKEKYPELDFDVFQPFEDDESMMPVDDGNIGTTSADPQMDDDATS
uniref:Uncharacterized protein n=1 Tax=Fagus sylvatica TaxID=28930 RepID=A0A2N9HWH4_FAGSY